MSDFEEKIIGAIATVLAVAFIALILSGGLIFGPAEGGDEPQPSDEHYCVSYRAPTPGCV
jgi:hypothetical protein